MINFEKRENKIHVNLSIKKGIIDEIDRLAKTEKLPRSNVIETLLNFALQELKKQGDKK